MSWLEAIGYLASLLVLSTFYMKTMIPLRCCAIASNVAFIAYGFFGEIYPVLVLHLLSPAPQRQAPAGASPPASGTSSARRPAGSRSTR